MIKKTPVAHGYGRVSHDIQVANDNSIPRQIGVITAYWQANLEPLGVQWGGVEHDEKHSSAFKKPFYQRKAGMRLLHKMNRGDYLIIDRVDRLCRGVKDWCSVDSLLKDMGITLCIIDCYGANVRRGTPMGDFLMNLFVSIAQMESQNISHRIKGAIRFKKMQGYWVQDPNKPPLGTRTVGIRGRRRLEWDAAKRADMAEIVRLRETGLSFEKVSQYMNARLNGVPVEKMASPNAKGQFWNNFKVERNYFRELFYRQLERDNPGIKASEIDWHAINKIGVYCKYEDYLAYRKDNLENAEI